MILIGLTGGIASGKSTVSNMLRQMKIPVIDADVISRLVVQKGSTVLSEIVREFGDSVAADNGELNRKALGKIVFNNSIMLDKLNSIIQPAIKLEIIKEIEKYRSANEKICALDIPLLYEFNYSDMMNYIIVIYVNLNLQIKRLKIRDRINEEEALKKINSQMPLKEKIKNADFVIDNSKTIEETQKQLMGIIAKICNLEDLDV